MQIGVIGAGQCSEETAKVAEKVGRSIAQKGDVLICGGLGGVMEAAAKGAKEGGGMTIGILPGCKSNEANKYIDIKIVTDLGQARNVLVVRSSDALIAVEGGYGTLSEIAIALKIGKPVIGLNTWEVSEKIIKANNAKEAVDLAVKMVDE